MADLECSLALVVGRSKISECTPERIASPAVAGTRDLSLN